MRFLNDPHYLLGEVAVMSEIVRGLKKSGIEFHQNVQLHFVVKLYKARHSQHAGVAEYMVLRKPSGRLLHPLQLNLPLT